MPTTGLKGRGAREENTAVWLLPDHQEVAPLLASLGQAFTVAAEPRRKTTATWFDTFDWRLYSHGQLLCHDHAAWHLLSREVGEEMASLARPECGQWRFCREFPASRLRVLLEPLLAVRRLLKLFSAETTTVSLRVQNDDAKTVALVVAETHRIEEGAAIVPIVRLRGVRGYSREYEAVRSFFNGRGIQAQVDPSTFFTQGVRSSGRFPLDYTSRFRPSLRPEMTGRQAMVALYRDLLSVIRRNEAGVLEDLDCEFLHDFRVAVRRTRSGLGQVKSVLPAGVTATFGTGFAWLGQVTGPTRDLDVFLQAENACNARLPEESRPALAPFFAELRRRRRAEFTLLVRQLRSAKYRRLTADWEKFLESGGKGRATENSALPVKELARGIIGRRFRRLRKAGQTLGPSSSDQEYHRLRIQGKKLRYTLEFFSALFPPDALEQAIRQLKQLQDNLGAYNDLAVQADVLRDYLAGLSGSRRNLEQAAAIGALLASFDAEQHRVREEFSGRFAAFSRPENTELYTRHCRRKSFT